MSVAERREPDPTASESREPGTAPRPGLWAGTPIGLLAALGAGVIVSGILTQLGFVSRRWLGFCVATAAYGGMLATALGWAATAATMSREEAPPVDARATRAGVDKRGLRAGAVPCVSVGLVGLSTFAATVHPFGGLVALSGLLWIVKHARSGALVGLGLGTPTSALAVATGIAAGVGLGGHLLLSASLTLGYRPHVSDVTSLAGALAYDVGVQVLATESFFRGAVFNRLQRRWSFAVAATLSSGACVIRYVVDPLLPGTAELMTGALFYVTILSVVNAALFWRFGTLVPGLVCAATFFAAYRLLGA